MNANIDTRKKGRDTSRIHPKMRPLPLKKRKNDGEELPGWRECEEMVLTMLEDNFLIGELIRSRVN